MWLLTIIEAPNDNMQLKPGMTASITIYTSEVSNVLVVPAAALQFKPDSLLIVKFHLNPGESDNRKRGGAKREMPAVRGTDSLGNKIIKGRVWIWMDSLTIVPRPVTIGLDDKTLVEIKSGLKADEVVVTGYKKLKKGSTPTNTAAKSPFVPARGGGSGRGQPH
jgi:HlyD family secretion protein